MFLANVDVAIANIAAPVFVLTADPPVPASERDLLRRVAELSVTTFVVLNKADHLRHRSTRRGPHRFTCP